MQLIMGSLFKQYEQSEICKADIFKMLFNKCLPGWHTEGVYHETKKEKQH